MPQNKTHAQVILLISILVFWVFSDTYLLSKIHIFAGPIVILLYNLPLSTVLWEVFALSLFCDAIQASPRLGFIAISYLGATLFSWRLRMFFFKDSALTLPLMASVFSAIATLLQVVESFLLDIPTPEYTSLWVLTDCFCMPLVDGIAAHIFFDLLPKFLRMYLVYFLRNKKRNSS